MSDILDNYISIDRNVYQLSVDEEDGVVEECQPIRELIASPTAFSPMETLFWKEISEIPVKKRSKDEQRYYLELMGRRGIVPNVKGNKHKGRRSKGNE